MNQFEIIVVGLLLTMVIGMFIIGKWVMVIMINIRIINREIEQHNLIDLELRFFRFLHFNGEKEEGSKYYLGKIIQTFSESKSDYIDEKEKEKYIEQYKSDKPIFVLQTHGGDRSQEMDYNWARDLPDSEI